jgi:hypothetical protein
VILDEITVSNKARLHSLLEDERICPELRVQDFDDYFTLINGTVSTYLLGTFT